MNVRVPTTPEGEIAFYGAMARGASGPRGRRVLGIVVLLLVLGFGLLGVISVFFSN